MLLPKVPKLKFFVCLFYFKEIVFLLLFSIFFSSQKTLNLWRHFFLLLPLGQCHLLNCVNASFRLCLYVKCKQSRLGLIMHFLQANTLAFQARGLHYLPQFPRIISTERIWYGEWSECWHKWMRFLVKPDDFVCSR